MSQRRGYTVFNGDDEERPWQVETISEGVYRVWTPDGRSLEVDAYAPDTNMLHLLCDKRSMDVGLTETKQGLQVHVGAERHSMQVLNDRERRMRAAGGATGAGQGPELTSPMAGMVVKVIAEPGAVVASGDPLVVVEAMKMENDLKAHREGVIGAISVDEGDTVEIGDVLVTIEEE